MLLKYGGRRKPPGNLEPGLWRCGKLFNDSVCESLSDEVNSFLIIKVFFQVMHTPYSLKSTEKLKRRNKIPFLSSHHKVAYDILSCLQHCLYAAIQIALNSTVFTSWHMAAPSCGEMRPGFLAASRPGPRRRSHLPHRSPGTGRTAGEVTFPWPAALVVFQFCCLNSACNKSWLGYRDPIYFTVLKRPCLL